jgi:hypothetical protein
VVPVPPVNQVPVMSSGGVLAAPLRAQRDVTRCANDAARSTCLSASIVIDQLPTRPTNQRNRASGIRERDGPRSRGRYGL